VWIAAIWPNHGLEEKARVRDRASHRADIGVGAKQIRRLQMRNRTERRLEPDDPAAGGRNADRAAAVRAKRKRPHARGDGDRRAARRAAASVRFAPRVEGAAEERALGKGLVAEFRSRGLADQD